MANPFSKAFSIPQIHLDAAADFWNRNTKSRRVESSQGGTARDIWDQGASYLTKKAREVDMDKPGGEWKRATDALNKELPIDLTGRIGNAEEEREAGTRATMSRNRMDLYDRSNANRRNISMAQGRMGGPEKAKTLITKKIGGRGYA